MSVEVRQAEWVESLLELGVDLCRLFKAISSTSCQLMAVQMVLAACLSTNIVSSGVQNWPTDG